MCEIKFSVPGLKPIPVSEQAATYVIMESVDGLVFGFKVQGGIGTPLEGNELKSAAEWYKKQTAPPPPPEHAKTWECYEMHAYSRFAGCGSQCDECRAKQKRIENLKTKTDVT